MMIALPAMVEIALAIWAPPCCLGWRARETAPSDDQEAAEERDAAGDESDDV